MSRSRRTLDPHRGQDVLGVPPAPPWPTACSAGTPSGPSLITVPSRQHRVGALAVADRLDVRVRVGEERRGDGHAVGEVALAGGCGVDDADQGLGVGPGQRAQAAATGRGARPSARSRCSRLWVPHVPAEKTTCSAVNVRTGPSGIARSGVGTAPARRHLAAHLARRPSRPATRSPGCRQPTGRPAAGARRSRSSAGGPPRRPPRPGRGSSSPGCSWRCAGSRSCTRRTRCSRCAPGRRRRSRDPGR